MADVHLKTSLRNIIPRALLRTIRVSDHHLNFEFVHNGNNVADDVKCLSFFLLD